MRRTRWAVRSDMLFVCERITAALLSVYMGVGPFWLKPNSLKKPRSQVASLIARSIALISASALEWDTVESLFDFAIIAPDVVFR